MYKRQQLNGISGFPKPNESEYDTFTAGHSSTSVSIALGMACARDLSGGKEKIAAVIGDGSMTVSYTHLLHKGCRSPRLYSIRTDAHDERT